MVEITVAFKVTRTSYLLPRCEYVLKVALEHFKTYAIYNLESTSRFQMFTQREIWHHFHGYQYLLFQAHGYLIAAGSGCFVE